MNSCQICGRSFTEVSCCCDYATNEDGTHEDGYCIECCPNTWTEGMREQIRRSDIIRRLDESSSKVL